jgi:TrmH family RNA methyltransferase
MPADEVVESRANSLFKQFRALKELGTGERLCLLEGPKLVAEALRSGLTVEVAAVRDSPLRGEEARAVVNDLRRRGVPVRRFADALLGSVTELHTSQGLVALGVRPAPWDEERLFAGTPLVVVVDAVQNPGNLGGLLRTAEAAGATGAYLTTGSADPYGWKALRGSMGSAFRLPHVAVPDLGDVFDRLERRGVAVLAADADGELRYDEADLRGPVALVVGTEGEGLPPEALGRALRRVRIPLARPVESLNVGVAAGLVLFEAARQRGFPG